MNPFKVGDKVKHNKWPDHNGIVTSIQNDYVRTNDASYGFMYFSFELDSDPIKEAILLLKENGYGVVEPKPKLTGRVVVWGIPDTTNTYFSASLIEDTKKWINPLYVPIAILDWTEGQGLESTAEPDYHGSFSN